MKEVNKSEVLDAAAHSVYGYLARAAGSLWRMSCNSNDPPVNAVANRSSSSTSRPTALVTLPQPILDAENRAATGGPIKLADYSGKVLLVNLWATWCGPCRMETPELVKLHKGIKVAVWR